MAEIVKPIITEDTIWSTQGEKIPPTAEKIRTGWGREMMPAEWQNWSVNRQDQGLAYLFQVGIPEWDAITNYIGNKSVVMYNGSLYLAVIDSSNVEPTTNNSASWQKLVDKSSTAVLKTSASGVAELPNGTTGQRPSRNFPGDFRYNSTTKFLEYNDGNGWQELLSVSRLNEFAGGLGNIVPDAVIPENAVYNPVSTLKNNTNNSLNAVNAQLIALTNRTDYLLANSGGGGGGGGIEGDIVLTTKAGAIPVVQILPKPLGTNVSMSIGALGTGAIAAQTPDDMASGGFNRGPRALDFSRARAEAQDVASGEYSVILAGNSNRASGSNSAVISGTGNRAQGDYSYVVVGYANTAANSYAAVVGGYGNYATGLHSVVVAGNNNRADGQYAFVGNGSSNTALGEKAVVVGGQVNTASGQYSFVGSGEANTASAPRSVVVGGSGGVASAWYSFVGGGGNNQATGQEASVVGGNSNVANGYRSFIGGGSNNSTPAECSVVLGGGANQVHGQYSSILNGNQNVVASTASFGLIASGGYNRIESQRNFIGGGLANKATEAYAAVTTGNNNLASGVHSYIPFGSYNVASAPYSTVQGQQGNSRQNTKSVIHGTGGFNTEGEGNGDAQFGTYSLMGVSSGTTDIKLTTGVTGTVAAVTGVFIPPGSAWIVKAKILAQTPNNFVNAWEITTVVKRTAGTVEIAGVPTKTVILSETGALAANIVPDGVEGAFNVVVNSGGLANVHWLAKIETVELMTASEIS